jgi:hypothetical protein
MTVYQYVKLKLKTPTVTEYSCSQRKQVFKNTDHKPKSRFAYIKSVYTMAYTESDQLSLRLSSTDKTSHNHEIQHVDVFKIH